MNVGPDEQAELMDAIKRADEDGRKRIEIPREVAETIEKDTEHFRQVRYREAARAIMAPSEMLVWKADEPFPPKHKPVPQQRNDGARKYHGETAAGYDAKREDSPKWKQENAIIEDMLSDLEPGTTVLDCPCGTGRFLRLYEESGFNVICMDASDDMIKQAFAKGSVIKNDYVIGDITNTKLSDNIVDVSMNIRISRWVSPEGWLGEMQRVARKRIIFTARVRDHPHARSYDMINGLLNGWKITRDEGLPDDDAYRVIMLEPV
jgi:hypothetical protein